LPGPIVLTLDLRLKHRCLREIASLINAAAMLPVLASKTPVLHRILMSSSIHPSRSMSRPTAAIKTGRDNTTQESWIENFNKADMPLTGASSRFIETNYAYRSRWMSPERKQMYLPLVRSLLLYLAVTTSFFIEVVPACATEIAIAEEGDSRLSIVISPQASETVRNGATELASYLERISGASFAIEKGAAPEGLVVGSRRILQTLRWN